VVLRMLANVRQKTIEPIIGATVARGTLVHTQGERMKSALSIQAG
jgi:hypothetical protein